MLLYGGRPVHDGTAAIGGRLRDLYRQFGVQPSDVAVDLVSIALAVTAADTFVPRRQSDNGWARRLDVELPLCSPDIWAKARPDLERLLSFLSGDRWRFGFRPDGEAPPPMEAVRRHRSVVDVSGGDLVTLFSGARHAAGGSGIAIDFARSPIVIFGLAANPATTVRSHARAFERIRLRYDYANSGNHLLSENRKKKTPENNALFAK